MINNGTSQYANAYFEISSIKAFAVNSSVLVNANGSSAANTSSGSSGSSGTGTASGAGASNTGGSSSGALSVASPEMWLGALAGVFGLAGMLLV